MKISVRTFFYLAATAAVTSPTTYAAAPPRAHELTPDYSFEQYLIDFGKEKAYHCKKSKLYKSKKLVFESNLERILKHNSNVQYDIKTGKRRNDADANAVSYHMGVNHFMEFTEDEIKSFYFGYDKKSILHKGLQLDEDKALLLKNDIGEGTDHKMDLPFDITELSSLPLSVNYATNITITTPVKNQGACGSCWSFSAIAALESHIALQSDLPVEILSPQELVSCVHNPNQCGGTGGCEGATAEIAYNYVADYGIVKEETFPYKASDDPVCPLNKYAQGKSKARNDLLTSSISTTKRRGLRTHRTNSIDADTPIIAKVKGYANVPSNDYLALMNAVAKHGPVVVALAASAWSFYEGGVYAPSPPTRALDWDLNHGVVVTGYGTDEETGEDYWLVRNSWGPGWGESGYIRLRRVNPASLVDDDMEGLDCGYDETPLDGIGCALNPDGSPIVQKKVKVCGTNGLLFDPVIPVGGYVV